MFDNRVRDHRWGFELSGNLEDEAGKFNGEGERRLRLSTNFTTPLPYSIAMTRATVEWHERISSQQFCRVRGCEASLQTVRRCISEMEERASLVNSNS